MRCSPHSSGDAAISSQSRGHGARRPGFARRTPQAACAGVGVYSSSGNETQVNDVDTHSIPDGDVATCNIKATCVWIGRKATFDRLFTLNRFNFKAACPHLISKAVAYSAEPPATGRSA